MTKQGGMGMTTFSVDNAAGAAKDLRNDIMSFSLGTPRGVQDITGLDVFAIERQVLLADLSYQLTGCFNPAADKSHPTLATASSSSTARTATLVVAAQSLAAEVLATDYAVNRGQDGSMGWTCPLVLQNGAVPTWTTV